MGGGEKEIDFHGDLLTVRSSSKMASRCVEDKTFSLLGLPLTDGYRLCLRVGGRMDGLLCCGEVLEVGRNRDS
jgi:hypothetical protein